jgi:hypothetical protein
MKIVSMNAYSKDLRLKVLSGIDRNAEAYAWQPVYRARNSEINHSFYSAALSFREDPFSATR